MSFSINLMFRKSAVYTLTESRITWNIKRFCSQRRSEPDDNSTKNLDISKDYDVNKVTKEDLEWRKPWNEDTKNYFRTLRIFYTENNNVEIARLIQSPINLSPSAIFSWLKNRKKEDDIIMQSYLPERNRVLGNELAAAHFVVYRGGAVKFHGEDIWIKADEDGNYSLPQQYVRNKYLEAIDCSEMTLYYEGLQNFSMLQRVTWLSVNGCENIDDWCLDKICGVFYKTLVYLDLRNCRNVTERGLTALWKMENLKILYLDDTLRSTAYEMTILLLQEHLPTLEIKVGDSVED